MAYKTSSQQRTGRRNWPAPPPEGEIRAISVTGTRSNYGEQSPWRNNWHGQGNLGTANVGRSTGSGRANTNRTGEDPIG